MTPKERLLNWVEEQVHLDLRRTHILMKLAMFADAEARGWAQIAYLAMAARCSERSVQYALRQLEDEGLIAKTDQMHRLKDSTRSVPIYQIAPHVPGICAPVSMGARSAPIDGAWVQDGEGMGAAVCTRIRNLEEPKVAIAPNAGAREAIANAVEDVEAAAPAAMLGVSDPEAVRAVLGELLADGVSLDAVTGGLRRMAESDWWRTRRVPPKLEDWLAKRQFRGYPPPAADPADPAHAVRPDDALPDDVIEGLGVVFCQTWLGGARWIEATRTLIPKLHNSAVQIRQRKPRELAALDVRIVSPRELSPEEAST